MKSIELKEKSTEQLILLIKSFKEENTHELSTSRAAVTKNLKALFDELGSRTDISPQLEIDLVKEMLDWALSKKTTYLRINLQLRLVKVLYAHAEYQSALSIITLLFKELKKMDEKILLVEVQLIESQIYHILKNLPKAKASLTGARALANTVYCGPDLQASLDLHAGTLYAEDRDFQTAYSFFYEAVEAKPERQEIASRAFVYLLGMLMMMDRCKEVEEVASAVNWKAAQLVSGHAECSISMMKRISKSITECSLSSFESLLNNPEVIACLDSWILTQLRSLASLVLEAKIKKMVYPYSKVQISYLATQLGLPIDQFISKISQMILDKQLTALIDQGSDTLQMMHADAARETDVLVILLSHRKFFSQL